MCLPPYRRGNNTPCKRSAYPRRRPRTLSAHPPSVVTPNHRSQRRNVYRRRGSASLAAGLSNAGLGGKLALRSETLLEPLIRVQRSLAPPTALPTRPPGRPPTSPTPPRPATAGFAARPPSEALTTSARYADEHTLPRDRPPVQRCPDGSVSRQASRSSQDPSRRRRPHALRSQLRSHGRQDDGTRYCISRSCEDAQNDGRAQIPAPGARRRASRRLLDPHGVLADCQERASGGGSG